MRKFGLIGKRLSHSFSKDYFSSFFKKEKMDAAYENYEIAAIDKMGELIVQTPELEGLNVTIPYKETCMALLHDCDEAAKAIGAVNVIRINRHNGSIGLKGFNTDMPAFRDTITPLLKRHHKRALILGTGGASKAVRHALGQLGIETVLVSRTKQTADTLTYDEITEETIGEHTVIVNTTPCGMYPDTRSLPPLAYQGITRHHLLYDLVYNPTTTAFMEQGALRGAQCTNGLKMLYRQAELSWEIWNQ